ncbi:MAG: 50S ribosomal protein L23 [Candidatus Eremiobacteraeota bacterium]|nr:50S ribosomal protein L23 [Candidatus Eremiobacteraeota bacterium]
MKTVRDIIKKPIITEKSMEGAAINKYTFKVEKTANKVEIRKAIEKIFNVKVISVNTLNVTGKVRRRGKYEGRTSDWKKAIVTLKEGDKIEIGGVDYFEQ